MVSLMFLRRTRPLSHQGPALPCLHTFTEHNVVNLALVSNSKVALVFKVNDLTHVFEKYGFNMVDGVT